MSELHCIEWNHPNLGRISEAVCLRHEGDVLRALRTLGIGCGGSTESERSTCTRCTNDGIPARAWLRKEYAE